MSDSSVKYSPLESENFTTVFKGANSACSSSNSARTYLNHDIPSVESCSTVRELQQRQSK